MAGITRRDVLKRGSQLAALMGLGVSAIPKLARALEQLAGGNAPVIWLQGQSCTGCSVSLLNAQSPSAVKLLTQYISLKFHANLSTATGQQCMDILDTLVEAGGYILAVEGSVPVAMPEACEIGGQSLVKLLPRVAGRAKAVLAVGTCATFGGIPAAEQAPTGAQGVPGFLKDCSVSVPVISLPGCPAHPDWMVGTIAHVLKFGIPALDAKGRPKMFYSKLVHDQCTRFADYERQRFAKSFSDEGCLFKLGCLGTVTEGDCTLRQWNSGTNSCIRSGAPCVGCTTEQFALKRDLPFYRKSELQNGATSRARDVAP